MEIRRLLSDRAKRLDDSEVSNHRLQKEIATANGSAAEMQHLVDESDQRIQVWGGYD